MGVGDAEYHLQGFGCLSEDESHDVFVLAYDEGSEAFRRGPGFAHREVGPLEDGVVADVVAHE